jgi:uncharacterized protein
MPETRLTQIGQGQFQPTNTSRDDIYGWKVTWWAGSPGYWLISAGQNERDVDDCRAGLPLAADASLEVASTPAIDQFVATVKTRGGKVIVPKMTVPGKGWLVYCQDTEGTVFGIVQDDGAAR